MQARPGERGDHVQGASPDRPVERSPQRLAVDGDDPGAVLAEDVGKPGERRRPRRRVDQPKQPGERVVARQSVFQAEEFAEQILPIFGEIGELDATLATADRRGRRDHQHV